MRTYSVNRPKSPRITVTRQEAPALDFANITISSQSIKTFRVTNTGQQALTFTMSGLSAPYYCYGATCANRSGFRRF